MSLVRRVLDRGGSAAILQADVANPAETDDAIAQIITDHGRLDTVVNNAGVMLVGRSSTPR